MPRIADCWLECTQCGKRVLLASGYIGSAFLEDDDRVYECCDKMNWDHNPDICPDCNGKGKPDPKKRRRFG